MDRPDSNLYGKDMHASMTWSMHLCSRRPRSEYAACILWGKRRASPRTPKRRSATQEKTGECPDPDSLLTRPGAAIIFWRFFLILEGIRW